MTSLGLVTLTLATWLSYLQHPSLDMPRRVAVAESATIEATAPSQLVIDEALSLLGSPYRRGGSNPEDGIDCAHLVRKAYSVIGIELPQSAVQQIQVGDEIDKSEIQPGDLVFFKNTYKKGISHVGIALGDDLFVHAAGRKRGVVVSSLESKYFRLHFAGARRVAGEAQAGGN